MLIKQRFLVVAMLFLFVACYTPRNDTNVNLSKEEAMKEEFQSKPQPESDSALIRSTFLNFKKSLLTFSATDMTRISQMPIKGECGYYRLSKNASTDTSTGLITKELMLNNCEFLDSIELAVLRQYQVFAKNEVVTYDGRQFATNLWVSGDCS